MSVKNILIILSMLMVIPAIASDIQSLPYDNLKEGSKINLAAGNSWSTKVNKKDNYFIKAGSEFYSKDKSSFFDTGCSYVFINKGRLLGYSSYSMKFYEFGPAGSYVVKRELLTDEIQPLFKDFKIIKISDFSSTTNVYKFKKKHSSQKILVLNDTDRDFSNYSFSTNNAKYEQYPINNAIEITRSGMIQFSRFGENAKNAPWFVILVR